MTPYTSHTRPLSEDSTPRLSPSLLSFLPSVVKARLPGLSPLHSRSNSIYNYRHKSSVSAPPSGSQTPVSRAESDIFWSSRNAERSYYSTDSTECASKGENEIPQMDMKEPLPAYEGLSGIEWKYANQGIAHLLTHGAMVANSVDRAQPPLIRG